MDIEKVRDWLECQQDNDCDMELSPDDMYEVSNSLLKSSNADRYTDINGQPLKGIDCLIAKIQLNIRDLTGQYFTDAEALERIGEILIHASIEMAPSVRSKTVKDSILTHDVLSRALDLKAGHYATNRRQGYYIVLEQALSITPYEHRVMTAIASLYHAGNEYVSRAMIYKAMGGKGRPSSAICESITAAIENIRRQTVSINCDNECGQYDDARIVNEPLLRCSGWREVTINGVTADAIKIDAMPALVVFASVRNHVAYVPLEVMQMPLQVRIIKGKQILSQLRINNGNLALQNRLLMAIYSKTYAQSKDGSKRLRWDTLEKATHLRLRDVLKPNTATMLDRYMELGIVDHYTIDRIGVTIYLP